MNRFLREFLAFYRARTRSLQTVWEPGDAEALAIFLKTAAGARLENNLILESVEQDRQATINTHNQSWACGVATGFRMAISILKAFSEVSPKGDEDTKPRNGDRAALLRERLRP